MSKRKRKRLLIFTGVSLLILLIALLFSYTNIFRKIPGADFLLSAFGKSSEGNAENNGNAAENLTADTNLIPGSYEDMGTPTSDLPGSIEEQTGAVEDRTSDLETGITEESVPCGDGNGEKSEILFKTVETHEHIENGCMADVRIRFANGEEYTVLKDIMINTEKTDNGTISIFAELTEIQKLFYSSARTDAVIYTETEIIIAVKKHVRQGGNKDASVDGRGREQVFNGVGNYRPVKDIITLINEEGFLDSETMDALYLARERLEERLLNASVFYRQELQDALRKGLGFDTGNWIVN